MKIICVGRNYAEHAREMKHEVPEKPVLFMKPQTALKRKNLPFFLPDFSNDVHYETELVFHICKNGKNIAPSFASAYIDQVTVGIDFTARDLQTYQKQKGLPWEIAKGFDGSACVGKWKPLSEIEITDGIDFSMKLNEELRQTGNSNNMIYSIEEIIAYASRFFLLLKGDLIFTGTPAGVGKVAIGDRLECFLQNESVLQFEVK
jgi:2-keto-4-pentenoate hydratase/2-oxohepta-3-ene-1,7-dioic acid hydratase in catechol pathway